MRPRRDDFFNRAIREMHRLPPVDSFLQKRAEWMVKEAGIQEKLANKIVYADKLAGKVEKGLDIACLGAGKAHEADEIDQLLPGSHIVMIDPHDYMSAPVDKRLRTLAHNAEYAEASLDATSLQNIEDRSLDAVTLFFVLHHLTEQEQAQTLQEVQRVLKDDGYVFIAEDIVEGDEAKKVAVRIDRTMNAEVASVTPQNYLGKQELIDLFHEHGFEVDSEKIDKSEKVEHGFFVLQRQRQAQEQERAR